MDQIRTILQINNVIPRRAVVLADGRLGDRVQWPGHPELDLLSRLCEVARASAGQPHHPRQTAELLEAALRDNAPGAWQCVCDDLSTDDLDLDVAAVVLRQPTHAAALVGCLVGARDGKHLLHVACLLTKVVDRLSEEARAEVGRALACQLRAVMHVLLVHGACMTRGVLEAALSGFGRLLARTGLPDCQVAEAVLWALGRRADDLLRLFLHVPPSFVDHRPHQVMPALLERAQATTPAKYPLVAMLARVVDHRPELVHGLEGTLSEIIRGALPAEEFDARDALAAASLAVALGTCRDSTTAALGRALRHCSASFISEIERQAGRPAQRHQ
jgi:hypothetical protein